MKKTSEILLPFCKSALMSFSARNLFSAFNMGLILKFLLSGHRNAFTTNGHTTFYNLSAVFCFHTAAETMHLSSTTFFRLLCFFRLNKNLKNKGLKNLH